MFSFLAALGFSMIPVSPSCCGWFSSSKVSILYCLVLYSICGFGFLLVSSPVKHRFLGCMRLGGC